MERTSGGVRRVHSALFVDFDNIYLSLAQQDDQVADRFATNPDLWLAWLEQTMPCFNLDAEESNRRILIRRCYLNPQAFSFCRPYFIRAAFEVIDCPRLTSRGKTSTDILMVMDVLDTLNHPTFFDEFIILSGDADFTPVLLRLRKHARRSVVLSAGYVSPAYKASCDYLVSQEVFVRDALGIIDQEDELGFELEDSALNDATANLLGRMAHRLYEAAIVPGGVEASELPQVYKEFEEFRQGTDWLGFHSLRYLSQAIVSQRKDLALVDDDPWRVVRVSKESLEQVAAVPPGPVEPAERPSGELKAAASEWIQAIVRASPSAVTMASLAQAMIQRFGDQVSSTDWLGAGTFKSLLVTLDLGDLEMTSVVPGYVYDPARHAVPTAGQVETTAASPSGVLLDTFSLKWPELAPLAQKVHQLTDMPYLMPEHFPLLIRELAREINERGYQMTRTSKTVRDRCVERGAPIARSHVNFVLVGIGYTGYRFGHNTPEDPARLGEALVQNTINLCRTAQFYPSDAEVSQIRQWIMGSPASEAGESE